MTTATDRTSFQTRIVAEPDEDTHRLVFADWLEENGEAERAEFIRDQCKTDCPDCGGRDGEVGPCGLTNYYRKCYACESRRNRERDLLTRHETDWRRAGPCKRCNGVPYPKFHEPAPEGLPPCRDCNGAGDAGGLLWAFPSPSRYSSRLESVKVEFRRGFPFLVTVPRLADALVEGDCPMCEGTGRCSPIGGSCAACRIPGAISVHGSAKVLLPTPWLSAVLAHHPVQEVVPADKEPYQSGAYVYSWFGPSEELAERPHRLPQEVWQSLEHVDYKSVESALSALSRTIVTLGRGGAPGRRG